MDIHSLYEQSVAFHGHRCPGLAIGVRAAAEAKRLLEADFSQDEEIVCVTENDACGVDGIQVILGCSVGKGNLLFRLRGKQAYSFFHRQTGKNIRLVLKALPKMDREEKQDFLLTAPFEELFEVKVPTFALPEEARIFASIVCEKCGENTAEPYIRLEQGTKLCTDCFRAYSRTF